MRRLIKPRLPTGLAEAPKRPLQTPQREWLRGPLRKWSEQQIEAALQANPTWLLPEQVHAECQLFNNGKSDNSFYIWQWVSLGLAASADW